MQPRKRKIYKVHHEDDHYDHFNGCWVLLLVLVGAAIVTWVFAAGTTTSGHEFARLKGKGVPLLRTKCVTGERLNADVGVCVPVIRYPVQADPHIMDKGVSPCDSFFQHSCGKWISEHTNENRAFGSVTRENTALVHTIVKEAPQGSPINRFFQSCMSTVVNGKYMRESILERDHMLRKILDDFWNINDLPVILGRLARVGYTTPISLSIEKHPLHPSMIPLIRWDGYEDISNDMVAIILTGTNSHQFLQANAKMESFLKVQKGLNDHHDKSEDSITSYVEYIDEGLFERDMTTMGDLVGSAWNWEQYFEEIDGTALGYLAKDNQQVWAPDVQYIRWFTANAQTAFTIHEWRAWIEFSILYHTHEYVPQLPPNSYFKEHVWSPVGPKASRNIPHVMKRSGTSRYGESDCVKLTQYLLPGLVSQHYLANYFDGAEHTRRRVTELGERVREHVAELIGESEWLTPKTRRNLVKKAKAIIVRAVHPSTWNPEPFAAELIADRYLHNLNIIRRWRVRQNLVLWSSYALDDHRLNRDVVQRFGSPLSTVNAFYSPVTNTITVFAGILRSPFYDDRYNVASVLASVGTVLGHEFSHGFDKDGVRFDEAGNFRKRGDGWIDNNDIEGFSQRMQCIVDEYTVNDLNVDCTTTARKRDAYGEQTLGENIADIVGVHAAYRTFLTLSNETEKSDSARKWWWITFAQMWCETYDEAHRCDRIYDDVHAESLFRVDKTLRNQQAFQEDFNCIPNTDKMARPDSERCILYGS